MSNSWNNSPEKEEWLDSGGRDEDYQYYYNKWDTRTMLEAQRQQQQRS